MNLQRRVVANLKDMAAASVSTSKGILLRIDFEKTFSNAPEWSLTMQAATDVMGEMETLKFIFTHSWGGESQVGVVSLFKQLVGECSQFR
ncbi:hypothetical protein TorRG33x02_174390 [Trema orientale]|uniref:Uncharacterized protein n=1 Tax=Trema orientale TaxID=63057 RepID=A0A2P5EML5_TREOI|nr:hypothetical protein TorRG33x02_174390 [Trema orientale]